MAGSLPAAMAMRGKKAAPRCRGGLVAVVFALLAGCSAAVPEAEAPVPQTSLEARARHPAALSLPPAESLMGLGAGDVLARFGAPDLRRAEPPAELWQYRSADCVLEVILYAESGTPQVIGSQIYARSVEGTARCPSLSAAAKSRQSPL
jgi:hypothetical protein